MEAFLKKAHYTRLICQLFISLEFGAADMSDTLPNRFLQHLRQNPQILDARLQRRLP